MGRGTMLGLGFSVRFKRDDYTHAIRSCALECRGMSMLLEDGNQAFMGFAPPCESLAEFEAQIDRLLDKLNAVRREARDAFRV
jgi:hypothetical protein